jgi:glycosyltransferase involved in cell wall biosynthesis
MEVVSQAQPPRLAVLHVAHTGEGGVGKCALDLAADQIGRGWEVTVATEPGSELAQQAAAAGVQVVPWVATRNPTPRLPGELRRLRAIIRSVRPDVVHLHTSKAGLCGRLAVRGRIPTLFQPHCWSFEAVEGMLSRLVALWERLGARWADAIICVSEAEHAQGVAHRIRAKYRVIPNGVDLSRFTHTDEAGRFAARERLGLEDQPLVVCVGRLSRQKGQDLLVDSWSAVRRRVPDAELALVGDGEKMDELRRQADSSVRLLGHRTDVADWLAACDVVVLPSRWEGMSLGMLEAMAAGRSLVVTDVHGAREALDDTGAIVPPEDPEALAGAITERLLDPAKRQAEGAAAAARAREKFDLRDTLKRVAELCQEVVSARR